MTFEMYRPGEDSLADGPSADVVDHWLDEALRAVPLPDGFFARMCTLADSPPDRADDSRADGRDNSAHPLPQRRTDGTSRRSEASTRGSRPR